MKRFILPLSAMLFAVVFTFPQISSAQTTSDLQAQISALLAEVQQLQTQLAAQGGGTTAVFCYTFTSNLSIGESGAAVTALQTALQKDGETVSVTGTFDDQTASAVTGFQEKYASAILTPKGLQYGTGYVGAATRAELNGLYGCGTTTTTTTSTPPPFFPTVPSSPTITVTSPAGAAGGQSISEGTNFTIQWISSGVSNVMLALCNYSGTCQSLTGIGSVSASSGNYNWYVDPNDLMFPGSNLRIKITDVASGVSGYSGWFSVGVIGVTPTSTATNSIVPVTVTSPAAGQSFAQGSTMNIQWTPASGGVAQIQLVSTSGGESPIIYGEKVFGDPVDYSGYYDFPVSPGIPVDSYYVKLINPENDNGTPLNVIGQSGVFNVTAPTPTQVTVTSPVAGQTFTPGSVMTVQWAPVSPSVTEIDMVPTDGSYPTHGTWLYRLGNGSGYPGPSLSYGFGSPLPSNIPPGTYYIVFYASGTLVGQSGVFTVAAPSTPVANPYDLNGDGVVNVVDFQILSNAVAGINTTCGLKCDLNGDGQVNVVDLQKMINYLNSIGINPNTPTAMLSINNSANAQSFTAGQSWTLSLASNVTSAPFSFCYQNTPPGGSAGAVSCSSSFGTTDEDGNWSLSGTFASSTIGSDTEWITFSSPSLSSNHISFSVAAPSVSVATGNQSGLATVFVSLAGLVQSLSNLLK